MFYAEFDSEYQAW